MREHILFSDNAVFPETAPRSYLNLLHRVTCLYYCLYYCLDMVITTVFSTGSRAQDCLCDLGKDAMGVQKYGAETSVCGKWAGPVCDRLQRCLAYVYVYVYLYVDMYMYACNCV